MDAIEQLHEMIEKSKKIVFFGGAGVSTESGIKDFRSEDGLYSEKYPYPPEYMLSIDLFQKDPKTFYDFYKEKLNCLNTKPNITHKYLKKLEDRGKLQAIITQNIDGLHQKAGSKNVYEIHGTIYQNHCTKCHKSYSPENVFHAKGIPTCDCGGVIKPDVVLYGEMLPEAYSKAIASLKGADMLIVAGTSLTVSPANQLVMMFEGKYLVLINRTPTPYDSITTLTIHENLKDVFNKIEELENRK